MANTTTTTQPPAANQQQSYPMASLYVGDLHPDVTEAMIYEKFSQSGPVLSIRVCRDMITRKSLGYAYVNFQQPQDAERALDTMNFDVMKGRAIRIMWSQRDPSLRKSGVGNIFIKNLDKSIEQKEFYDTFTVFGNILSCKIATDETGKSRGYGFVHFETEEAAVGATSKINGMMINGKKVFVGKFIPKVERHDYYGDKAFTNVFVKNFGQELDDEKLSDLFKTYGEITSAKVMTDDNDKSKGFGFVCFKEPEAAELAVNELNGSDFKGRALYCGRAQKKTERHYELRSRFEKQRMERSARYAAGVNLYVKNLDDTLDDDRLKKEFVVFGNITSAKVMTDQTGRSKGFGFVCFSNPEEATKAVTEMNGKIVCTKPLYVALAQRKEDRKQHLASQYMQRMTSRYPNMPMQLPMPMQQTQPPLTYNMMQMPRNQQAYMAAPMQRGPTPRWSGPPQSMPGNRMGTNFSMGPTNQGMQSAPGGPQQQMRPQRPSNPQTMIRAQQRAIIGNQPGQGHMPQTRTLASVVASGGPQTQGKPTATPATQRPVQQTGVARYNPNVRNIASNAMPAAVPTGMSQAPDEQLRIGNHDPITTSILANANPQEQKQMLGERLYPLVHEMHDELAGKITGMLLEIDNAELLHMLESNESLKAKVDEAVNVLQNHQAKGTAPPSSASVATAGDKQ